MIRKAGAALFLAVVVGASLLLVYSRERGEAVAAVPPAPASGEPHRAMYYDKLADGLVLCRLCPNRCRLTDGEIGLCRTRKNIGGELYSLVYGKIAACHVDPIEKKPFFHVLPGTTAFSIATPGCNMRCLFCQNWEISQSFPWEVQTTDLAPQQIVDAALKSGARSIAFTYSEPTIFYEYMLDIAKLARPKGLKIVIVSNGYINPEPLKELLAHVDAYKVDLKAFNEAFYRDLTGGSLEPILGTLKTIRESGVWLEIVTLLVPGQNDSEDEVRRLARWVRKNLGDDVPVHFTRFHPMHKLQNLPPTPVETVVRARKAAMEEGLKYVYAGNVPFAEGESTVSPKSGAVVVRRQGFFVTEINLEKGVAPDGEKIPGVWE